MSNITIELCAEDRARLDRLAEAMERRACDNCVANALDYLKKLTETESPAAKTVIDKDASKNAPAAIEESTLATTPSKEENPTEALPDAAPPMPTVDRAELRAKVIELSARGLKEQTRDIVRYYAQTVTAVPDDKVAECYAKLLELEA